MASEAVELEIATRTRPSRARSNVARSHPIGVSRLIVVAITLVARVSAVAAALDSSRCAPRGQSSLRRDPKAPDGTEPRGTRSSDPVVRRSSQAPDVFHVLRL